MKIKISKYNMFSVYAKSNLKSKLLILPPKLNILNQQEAVSKFNNTVEQINTELPKNYASSVFKRQKVAPHAIHFASENNLNLYENEHKALFGLSVTHSSQIKKINGFKIQCKKLIQYSETINPKYLNYVHKKDESFLYPTIIDRNTIEGYINNFEEIKNKKIITHTIIYEPQIESSIKQSKNKMIYTIDYETGINLAEEKTLTCNRYLYEYHLRGLINILEKKPHFILYQTKKRIDRINVLDEKKLTALIGPLAYYQNFESYKEVKILGENLTIKEELLNSYKFSLKMLELYGLEGNQNIKNIEYDDLKLNSNTFISNV